MKKFFFLISIRNYFLQLLYLTYFLCFHLINPESIEASDRFFINKEMNEKVDDWQARFEYARLLKNLKKYDEALDQYDALLKEKPDSNLVKIEIAEVLFYQGKSNEALIELEKIPQNEMSEQSLLLMAENYQALKEYARAEKIYRDLLEKKPNDSPIKLKLAELLSWEKRYAESIELYEELLTAYPEDIQLRRKYAFVLMWMGNDKEAAEELKKTLK